MVVLIDDNFNRADAASTPGSPQVGGPYTVRSGTWGINTNRLQGVTAGGQITFPAAANIDISITLGLASGSSVRPGIIIRWRDANNYVMLDTRSGSGDMTLYTCVAGTFTAIMPTFVYSGQPGDVVRLRAFGPRIEVFINGVPFGVGEDPFASLATAVAGIRSSSTSTAVDALTASDVTTNPVSWGASPQGFDDIELDFDSAVSLTPSLYKGRDTAVADESEIP